MHDEAKEKCDILHEPKIFGAKCLSIVNVAYFHSICMYDMCIRKNAKDSTPLCRAAAALAHACTQQGFEKDVHLRDTMSLKYCTGVFLNIYFLVFIQSHIK